MSGDVLFIPNRKSNQHPHEAWTYVGLRTHANLGLLLKVGHSIEPTKRLRDLHAQPLAILPIESEQHLLNALWQWHVWDGRAWSNAQVWDGFTEWHYATKDALDRVAAHIRSLSATTGVA